MINGKVEISLEDWTKLNDRIQRLESQNIRLNKEIDRLLDVYGKMGIPECVVGSLGIDVNPSCRYVDDVVTGVRSYLIDIEVPKKVLHRE